MADKKLTAMMVDDCLHDPVLGAKLLLGFKIIPPYMELRLWSLWTMGLFVDNSGFGSAKSLSIAIVYALRCMLMEGRTEGLLNYTFEQGKLLFTKYFEPWAARSPIYRDQICKNKFGDIEVLRGSSAWEVRFKKESQIRCIPPDFKGKSERAGSEDWTDGAFDEATKYPDIQNFIKQFITRVRRPVSDHYDPSDPVFQNHIYLAGTAREIPHPFHTAFVETVLEAIAKKDPNQDYQSWNFEFIPADVRERLTNMTAIKLAMKSLPRDKIEQEIFGRWSKATSTYYSATDIHMARREPSPIQLQRTP